MKKSNQLLSLLRKYKISEANVRMILGVLVILGVGILSYNLFKGQQPANVENNKTVREDQTKPQQSTEISEGNNGQQVFSGHLPAEHTVLSGENLWTIAEKYYQSGYNWVDIAKANNLTEPGRIFSGEKLTIPAVTARLKTVENVAEAKPANAISGGSYTVARGDNLWDIAVRAYGDGYKWTQIAAANHLTNPGVIYSGNNLVIPR